MAKEHVLAIDQERPRSRAMLFNHDGTVAGVAQEEHEQIYPQAGWVEHDLKEIWEKTQQVTSQVLRDNNLTAENIAAVGITNQRETTVVWDKNTGEPVYNAIVWQGTPDPADRASGRRRATRTRSSPRPGWSSPPTSPAPRSPGSWRTWRGHGSGLSGAICCSATPTWVIWNLTGGVNGGRHITDYTNASRTMLFNLADTDWDDHILDRLGIPVDAARAAAVLGSRDLRQHHRRRRPGRRGPDRRRRRRPAGGQALFGQTRFDVGQAKNTYGTGNFLLQNTGQEVALRSRGC